MDTTVHQWYLMAFILIMPCLRKVNALMVAPIRFAECQVANPETIDKGKQNRITFWYIIYIVEIYNERVKLALWHDGVEYLIK